MYSIKSIISILFLASIIGISSSSMIIEGIEITADKSLSVDVSPLICNNNYLISINISKLNYTIDGLCTSDDSSKWTLDFKIYDNDNNTQYINCLMSNVDFASNSTSIDANMMETFILNNGNGCINDYEINNNNNDDNNNITFLFGVNLYDNECNSIINEAIAIMNIECNNEETTQEPSSTANIEEYSSSYAEELSTTNMETTYVPDNSDFSTTNNEIITSTTNLPTQEIETTTISTTSTSTSTSSTAAATTSSSSSSTSTTSHLPASTLNDIVETTQSSTSQIIISPFLILTILFAVVHHL